MFAAALMFFSLVLIRPALAEPALQFSSSFYPPVTSEQKNGILDLVYQTLSARLGIKITIHNQPAAERILLNVNAGLDDGVVGRVPGLEKIYPNLIIIPVPVMKFQMMAFARDANFTASDPQSIQPYNIGIVRGWKILEAAANGAQSVTTVDNGKQLFTMLDKGRIDIALIEKLQGMEFIRQMRLHGIKMLQPPLIEGKWYLYVNKRHAALVPKLTAGLREMETDGTIERIYQTVVHRYIP